MHLFFSCEHATSRIPKALASLFAGCRLTLESHRGVDIGALPLARALSRQTGAPMQRAYVSRLVVDLNRSARHPRCLSEMTQRLPALAQAHLRRSYYEPYRRKLAAHIESFVHQGTPVVHIGVHSFTPIWQGAVRRVDVGLLFDPKRPQEALLCRAWQQALQARRPLWRVRLNNPYRGTADGLTTSLRRALAPGAYLGIELEMNQALVAAEPGERRAAYADIVRSFQTVWRSFRDRQTPDADATDSRQVIWDAGRRG